MSIHAAAAACKIRFNVQMSNYMKTITVSGGNLFQLAMLYLGSAEQWNRIAQANGLVDPMLSGIMTLVIPATDPDAGGGVYDPA